MKFADAIKHAVDMFDSTVFLDRIRTEDPTMMKQLSIVKRINQLGFLTNASQAGLKRKIKGGEIHERAYVTGFMKEKEATEFIRKMALYTDKNAIYAPVCNENVVIPANLDIPLTITKKKGIVTVVTHDSMAHPKSVNYIFRQEVGLNKTEKAVYIICWDSEWNRLASNKDGLFRDIIRCL